MRISLRGMVLLVSALMMAVVGTSAQKPTLLKHAASSLEAAFTYDAMRSNTSGGVNFWMQGGSAEVHGRFWSGLGAVANVSGMHTGDTSIAGTGLDLVTATFGPRYTWSPRHARYSFYGQGLAGEAIGFNSVFPGAGQAGSSASSMALNVGGGMSFTVHHNIALRVFKADWVRTQMPNATSGVQNNLRIGVGVVVRLP